MNTEIIVDLEKKQYHMLSRAILDDLYEMKSVKKEGTPQQENEIPDIGFLSDNPENTPCISTT